MAKESVKSELERLENLTPEARSRVDSALKAAIEREVVAGNVGDIASANIFSRGIVFSRLTPTDERLIRSLPEVDKMNETEFVKFADRLSELKTRSEHRR